MKFFTFLFICSISFSVFGQSWCPPGAEWTYGVDALVAGGYSTFTYDKDTLIDGETCKKLLVDGRYNPVDPTESKNPLYTFQRNDTVYYHYHGAFRPVLFWGAQLGDTITYRNNNSSLCDSIIFLVVDSIGTTTINNDTLRFYRTTNLMGDTSLPLYPFSVLVIERLGIINAHPIPYYSCHTDANDYRLRCYTDSAFALYNANPSIACDYLTGLNDVVENYRINLFPNPAVSQVNVFVVGTSFNQIEIWDMKGNGF